MPEPYVRYKDKPRELTLSTKLWRAKQQIERLEQEIEQRELLLARWTAYIQALESAQELGHELDELKRGLDLDSSWA